MSGRRATAAASDGLTSHAVDGRRTVGASGIVFSPRPSRPRLVPVPDQPAALLELGYPHLPVHALGDEILEPWDR